MRLRGPFAGAYAGALGLVVFSLIPFLLLSAAVLPLSDEIERSLHLSAHTFDITIALSTGAYAFGTVLAVQLASRLPPRRLLLIYEGVFVAASIATAWSPVSWMFIGGFVVQGLCTSLLLIAAVPPFVIGFGSEKLPMTGAVMNLCIFGAVAAGPTVGAFQAAGHGWRPLFWGVTVVAGLAFTLALLTYEDQPAAHPDAPVDVVAMVLAAAGCGFAFFGAGELEASRAASPEAVVPLLMGAVMLGALIAYEYRTHRPLMPVKALATTLPTFGIFTAAMASAASFGLMELVLLGLKKSSSPTTSGLLFLPEFVGAIAMAGLFGLLFRTRWTPVMALAGLLLLVGAAALWLAVGPIATPLVGLGAGMIGVGVGASVSPALYVTAFSLRSSEVQRVFALVELIRGVTAFLVAPVLAFLVVVVSTVARVGFLVTVWLCLGIAAAGALGAAVLLWAGRGPLQVPDLTRWQQKTEPAWESPPLFARFSTFRTRAAQPGRESAREVRGVHERGDRLRPSEEDHERAS
jgi:MFS family permease